LVHTSPEHGERILRYAAVRAEAYRSNSLCYIYWRTGGGGGGGGGGGSGGGGGGGGVLYT